MVGPEGAAMGAGDNGPRDIGGPGGAAPGVKLGRVGAGLVVLFRGEATDDTVSGACNLWI